MSTQLSLSKSKKRRLRRKKLKQFRNRMVQSKSTKIDKIHQPISYRQTVKSLRSDERSLVVGYFLINSAHYIPKDIINLCVFYCFIFDEFVVIPPSNAPIIGINNQIVTLSNNNNVFSRNLLEPSGRYHWAFQITQCNDAEINFGFIQNNKWIQGFTLRPSTYWTTSDIFDVYLDIDNKMAIYRITDAINDNEAVRLNIDNTHNIRLNLRIKTNPATIELIAFHAAKWFINRLQNNNNNDVTAHVGYARSIHGIDEKLKHYLIALNKYPLVESWNNEYLMCLLRNNEYDVAYNHAIKFKKGKNGIYALIDYYYCNEKSLEKNLSLMNIFNDNELKKMNLFSHIAYCYSNIYKGDNVNLQKEYKQNAFRYYQLYYDQHQYDSDDDAQKRLMLCIGNMANIQYLFFDDRTAALSLFLKLDQTEIDRRDFNGKIGCCYDTKKDFDKALRYYELYLNQHPNNAWMHRRICWVYQEHKKYDKAHEYLLKGLDVADNQEQKEAVYISLGVNAYLSDKVQDAIKYTKQALQLDKSSECQSVLIYYNLSKYYYRLSKYDESYQYISKAIKIDPNEVNVNGHYGIILYFMKRFEESIIYLDKCLLSEIKDPEFEDPELLPDCMYIYGQILYDKNEYNQSIDKCLNAINIHQFMDYKYKDKVYYLLGMNYEKLYQYEKCLEYTLKAKEFNQNNGEYQQKIASLQSKLNSKQLL